MNFKQAAIASALVVLASGAFANDVTNDIALSNGTIPFGALHTDSDDFTDIFNFTNVVGPVFASASLITIGFTPSQNIDFISVTLNGFDLAIMKSGAIEAAVTPEQLSLFGPLQLVVKGTTGAGLGGFSSYSGTVNVAAIPEPETYALMLAGLGAIGFMARRRKA